LDALEAEFDEQEEAEPTAEELEADALAVMTAERDELKDRFMRALADAENSRKRSDRDRREAENYGGSKLARDLLPVYDNMKRALEAATDEQREVSSALSLRCASWLTYLESMASCLFRLKLATSSIPNCTKLCSKRLCPEPKLARSFRSLRKGLCCMIVYYDLRKLGLALRLVKRSDLSFLAR
jgi:hypothetical protein